MKQNEPSNESDRRAFLGELIRRAQAGDSSALTRLFESHRDQLLRIARVRIGTGLAKKVDPEDIAQMTLVNAWRSLATFDASHAHRFVDWLAVIAENCIRDEAKRGSTEKRDWGKDVPIDSLRPTGGSTVSIPLPGPGGTPSQYASAAEKAEIYDRCLSELPRNYREVIVHRQLSEMNWDEVAREIGSPNAKAAFQLHFRAMELLEQRLKDAGF